MSDRKRVAEKEWQKKNGRPDSARISLEGKITSTTTVDQRMRVSLRMAHGSQRRLETANEFTPALRDRRFADLCLIPFRPKHSVYEVADLCPGRGKCSTSTHSWIRGNPWSRFGS